MICLQKKISNLLGIGFDENDLSEIHDKTTIKFSKKKGNGKILVQLEKPSELPTSSWSTRTVEIV